MVRNTDVGPYGDPTTDLVGWQEQCGHEVDHVVGSAAEAVGWGVNRVTVANILLTDHLSLE